MSLQRANCQGDAVHGLFLLPAHVAAKQSGFSSGLGEISVGSRTLATCYRNFWGAFLNTWVRQEETGSQTPGSSSALKAAVSSGSRFLFQRADALSGEPGRPNLHSRALSVAAVSSSGYAAGRQPD